MTEPAPSQSLVGHAIGALRRRHSSRAHSSHGYRTAFFVVAATPAAIALAAQIAAITLDRANRASEAHAATKIATALVARDVAMAKARVAPLMTRPTLTGLVERLAGSLPDGAQVHALAVDGDGAIRAEIDCPDPDILRAALRKDRVLALLRMIQQNPADDGVRVVLVSGRP